MSSLIDRTITALRTVHDDLAADVPSWSTEQLTAPSAASEWTVAQVLSHLGSGAEIGLAGYRAAFEGRPAPGNDFNQSVWSRWNAMSPAEQAAGFVQHDTALVEALESLSTEQRENTQVQLGFVPQPLPLSAITGMRLNETVLHTWDVRAGADPSATVDTEAADLLLREHLSGTLGFMLGFTAKAEHITEPTVVGIGDSGLAIVLDGSARISTSGDEPTAHLTGGPEAALRLISGRLRPPYLADGVEVSGNISLDQLRQVFPGY